MNKNLPIIGPGILFTLVAVLAATALAQSGDPISGPPKAAAGSPNAALVLTPRTNFALAPAKMSGTNLVIGFDQLAGFRLALTPELELTTNRTAWADSQVMAMIPESIRKLDGQRIFVEGFMLPIGYEKDRLAEFILVRDMPGCCYGGPPNAHEWVKAVVKSPKLTTEMDHPVRVRGIFRVGVERQGGYLSSIYRLDAETAEVAPGR
jgi:hypothetical protein